MSYLEHTRTNSSILLRIAASEIDIVVNTNLVSSIMLVAEIFVTITIVLTLTAIQPFIVGPLVLVIGAAAYGVYWLKRVRLMEAGRTIRIEHAEMMKWVQQALGDVRFGRLIGAEVSFAKAVGHAWRRYTNAQMTTLNIQRATRIAIESGALGAVVLLVIYFVLTVPNPSSALPALALLAVGSLRLVPGIARIVTLSQILRQLQSSTDVVVEQLRKAGTIAEARPAAPPLPLRQGIDLRGLSFSYPGAVRPALAAVSLSIRNGEMVGVVGPSGAGKSTLIDVLCGLISPDSGSILVDGIDIRTELARWQGSIGYVPQSVYILDDTIRANIAFAVPPADVDHAAVHRALETASLTEFVDTLPLGLETVVGERGAALSGGQRQRIAIARALYRDPSILVFDEATSALDAVTENAITEALRDIHGRKTIIIIAHRLTTVKGCDRLYLLQGGRLAGEGTFQELYAENRYFREIAELSDLDVGRLSAGMLDARVAP
jgi:ATP-binding cassette subfamily C protein